MNLGISTIWMAIAHPLGEKTTLDRSRENWESAYDSNTKGDKFKGYECKNLNIITIIIIINSYNLKSNNSSNYNKS